MRAIDDLRAPSSPFGDSLDRDRLTHAYLSSSIAVILLEISPLISNAYVLCDSSSYALQPSSALAGVSTRVPVLSNPSTARETIPL
jgi:hypothetical protein